MIRQKVNHTGRSNREYLQGIKPYNYQRAEPSSCTENLISATSSSRKIQSQVRDKETRNGGRNSGRGTNPRKARVSQKVRVGPEGGQEQTIRQTASLSAELVAYTGESKTSDWVRLQSAQGIKLPNIITKILEGASETASILLIDSLVPSARIANGVYVETLL